MSDELYCPLCGDYLGYWSDENPQCPGCKHVICDWMFDMAREDKREQK